MAEPLPRPLWDRMTGVRTLTTTRCSYLCLLPFALCFLICFSSSLAAPSSQAGERVKLPLPENSVPQFVVQLVAVGPAGRMQNRECSATGFLINEEGYLITNAHVVEDAQRCLEKAPGAKILAKLTINDARTALAVPCDVVGMDVPNDLALLKTERPLLPNPGEKPPYAVLDTRAVAVGTAVRVTGYPAASWQPVTQAGNVIWLGKTPLEETKTHPNPASDALGVGIHLRPGNSGSPVYRPDGLVIGVVDKRDPQRPEYSVAVAIHYAIELAERLGVRWHGAD
ncbi:MAG: serine protease [Terriglobia bacterium]